MIQQISAGLFTTNLYALLTETFESVHSIYLDVLEEYMLQTSKGPIDWGSSRQVDAVMAEEEEPKTRLRDSYNRVRATMVGFDSWDNDSRLGGALAIIMHTARHMGGFGIYYVCWWIDMNKELSFVHPGEILLEEFLVPMGISQNRLALDICVPARRINEITQGKRRITTDTALRLARYFNMPPQFWLGL